MVDELLKMIAECHLQKPQTTSKFGNFVARMLKYLAKNNITSFPGNHIIAHMMLVWVDDAWNCRWILGFENFIFLGLNFIEIVHKCKLSRKFHLKLERFNCTWTAPKCVSSVQGVKIECLNYQHFFHLNIGARIKLIIAPVRRQFLITTIITACMWKLSLSNNDLS